MAFGPNRTLFGGVFSETLGHLGWTLDFPESSDKIAVIEEVITGLQQYNASLKRDREIENAKKELKDALPFIEQLVNDPNFVNKVAEAGYQINVKKIVETFITAAGWKSDLKVIEPL